ncbi:MAG: sulfotransferase [Gammaproteobacteria bacterium]|nr:sulfotransferase [Gammaproteobacteria bacterium]
MPRRIHIVGTSDRSGTTLMMQLMVNCLAIDRYCSHERRIYKRAPRDYEIYCSKHPLDILGARTLLALDPNLFMVCLVRDPRDAVVSKHNRFPDRYWGINFSKWRTHYQLAKRLAPHPRVLVVAYESLVDDPDRLQNELMACMPFLRKRADFSQFHEVATPTSDRAERALGGVRPISTRSVGAWRSHKPRIVAQLAIHGDISDELIALGYERDRRWLHELAGIEADNGQSGNPDRRLPTTERNDRLTACVNIGLYALAKMKRRVVLTWRTWTPGTPR